MSARGLGHDSKRWLVGKGGRDRLAQPLPFRGILDGMAAIQQGMVAIDAWLAENWNGEAEARFVMPKAFPAITLRGPRQPCPRAACEILALGQAALTDVHDIAFRLQ